MMNNRIENKKSVKGKINIMRLLKYVVGLSIVMFLVLMTNWNIFDLARYETRINSIFLDDEVSETLKIGKSILKKAKKGGMYILSNQEIKEYYGFNKEKGNTIEGFNEIEEIQVFAAISPFDDTEIAIIKTKEEDKIERLLQRRLENIKKNHENAINNKSKDNEDGKILYKRPYYILIYGKNVKEITKAINEVINKEV